ncbi:MAG: 30S ribosomal protein S17 [Polyangiaceae bacterium]
MTENTQPGHGAGEIAGETTAQELKHGRRRKMIGRVVSAKMQKTVVVEVVTHSRDALYGKYVRSRARYKAHDEKNELAAGDQVEIQEHRPISRDKRWAVTRLIKKFVQE